MCQLTLGLFLTFALAFSSPLAAAMKMDESVAGWIETVGGKFVANPSGQITEVDLTLSWVTDDDLLRIGELKELRKITLAHTKISDLGLANLRHLRNVESLNCFYCEYLTDGAIAYLKDWTKLKQLNVRGTEVTSRVFEHLAKMKGLQSLDVSCSRVNDDGFDALAPLEQLTELHIGGNKMTGLALPLLRLLPALKNLDVNGSQRTDSGRWGLALSDANVESITALTQLETLNMGGSMVTDIGLKTIEALTALQTLDLSRMEITSQGLRTLTALPRLRRLNLWQAAKVDDKAAEPILQMKSLEILDVGDTAVSDTFLMQLAAMKQLKTLLVTGTSVTKEGVESFKKARPDCRLFFGPKYKEVKSEEPTALRI